MMSKLGITGVTVSIEMSDKTYGSGTSSFCSVSSRLSDKADPVSMSMDEVVQDGVDKYLAAWQTLMQAALTTGQIESDQFQAQTKQALRRVGKVRALYQKIVKREEGEDE